MKINIERTYTISCSCDHGSRHTFSDELDAVRWAIKHIKDEHKEAYGRLVHKGRLAARSQNGCGYHDSDVSNGWAHAQASFRAAWIENYMRQHLDWPDTNKI